jgi:hypothetical protein
MLKKYNDVSKQLELVLKAASLKIRKEGNFSAGQLSALARLASEYRALLEFEQKAGEPSEERNNWFAELESADGPKIKSRR